MPHDLPTERHYQAGKKGFLDNLIYLEQIKGALNSPAAINNQIMAVKFPLK
jgi:hypothetical protein